LLFLRNELTQEQNQKLILHGKNSMNVMNAIEGGCFEQKKKKGFFLLCPTTLKQLHSNCIINETKYKMHLIIALCLAGLAIYFERSHQMVILSGITVINLGLAVLVLCKS
jgi:hypothetical protein